jgi:small-conductance mechanosensitive channel
VLRIPEPEVYFEDFGDSALEFKLYFYVADSFQVPRVKSDLRFAIERAFQAHDISIPFPQRDIHIIKK